jgi:antitoxin (DNA-binding transcriptional repressor) of toxin-antitoxin stability system
MQGAGNLLNELAERSAVEVADGPEVQPLVRPVAHIVALNGPRRDGGVFGTQSLRHEQINDMLAPLVHDRGHRLAVDVIKPAAKQREALRGQIDNRRSDVDLAVAT